MAVNTATTAIIIIRKNVALMQLVYEKCGINTIIKAFSYNTNRISIQRKWVAPIIGWVRRGVITKKNTPWRIVTSNTWNFTRCRWIQLSFIVLHWVRYKIPILRAHGIEGTFLTQYKYSFKKFMHILYIWFV